MKLQLARRHDERRTGTATSDPQTRRSEGAVQALAGLQLSEQEAALSPSGTPSAKVQRIASAGVEGAGGSLPHLGAIQHSFGHHDVSGVDAHVGGQAAEASRAIGAQAYATGSSVAFSQAPDLHTAAHEAAHVVQQKAGVQLAGGVGREGDAYERHADAVADRVVAGQPAADLLDAVPNAGAPRTPGVQARGTITATELEYAGGDDSYKEIIIHETIKGAVPKLVAGLKQGFVQPPELVFASEAEFQDLYNKMQQRKAEAGGYPPQPYYRTRANGFVYTDESGREWGVIKDREELTFGTAMHEALHLYSDHGWASTFGKSAEEGMTELFTRYVLWNIHSSVDRSVYEGEFNACDKLKDAFGLATIGAAFFDGDIAGLGSKAESTGWFDSLGVWRDSMIRKQFGVAASAFG